MANGHQVDSTDRQFSHERWFHQTCNKVKIDGTRSMGMKRMHTFTFKTDWNSLRLHFFIHKWGCGSYKDQDGWEKEAPSTLITQWMLFITLFHRLRWELFTFEHISGSYVISNRCQEKLGSGGSCDREVNAGTWHICHSVCVWKVKESCESHLSRDTHLASKAWLWTSF